MKKSFKEYFLEDSDDLSEQAIAMKGDWKEGIDKISGTSETVTNLKWVKLGDIHIPELNKSFEFRQLRNSLEFMLGYWRVKEIKTKAGIEKVNIFESVFQIGLSRYKSVEKKLGYKRLINVNGVAVLKGYSGKGISTIIYKYLVNELEYNILGDEQQYFGARKLWSRLSKELDVEVDLIDIKEKKVIESNIILHHGQYDEDFDKRLWSYEDDKQNIRSVLRRIL